ncbi:MAG: hypothetical protein GX455_07795 [Phycisphaerae bacterium]|nr:hypothetical protein [Phycisphaerae bacterium]
MIRILSATICFACLIVSGNLLGAVETATDSQWVESTGRQIRQTADAYLRETARARFEYEYTGRFLNEASRTALLQQSQKLREQLNPLLQKQKERLDLIERYNGADWDELYGRTGLWRRLRTDWLSGNWWTAQADYYSALASASPQRESLCRQILEQHQGQAEPFGGPAGRVLTARVLALKGETNPADRKQALEILDTIIANSSPSIPDPVRLSAMIQSFSIQGKIEPQQIQSLAALCRKETCADQFELRLSAGFLELRLKCGTMTILSDLPTPSSARSFAGSILLAELDDAFRGGRLGREVVSGYPLAAVRLAVEAAEAEGPQKYRDLLAELCKIPALSNPQIYYAAGRAWQEDSPVRAMEYYLRCSAEQHRQPDANLPIEPLALAEQAARLAIRIFQSEPNKAGLAEPAIRLYLDLAGPKMDPAIQYGFVSVLRNCGKGPEADALLDRIVRTEGPYRNPARLDRIVQGLQERADSAKAGLNAMEELTQLITDIPTDATGLDRGVRAEACRFLCRLLLEGGEPVNAQKVLVLLEQNPGLERRRVAPLLACALRILDRPVEAVRALAVAVGPQDCNSVGEAVLSLSAVLEQIEAYETLPTFRSFLNDFDTVSEYALGCAPAELRSHARFVRAEVLSVMPESEKLTEAMRILDEIAAGGQLSDLNWIRCQARIQESRGEFASAVKLWTQIADSLRFVAGKTPEPAWWQARYHALRCFSRLPECKIGDIEHAVQVLLSSHGPAPAPWDQKLQSLML